VQEAGAYQGGVRAEQNLSLSEAAFEPFRHYADFTHWRLTSDYKVTTLGFRTAVAMSKVLCIGERW
jgi:hypothetical protein